MADITLTEAERKAIFDADPAHPMVNARVFAAVEQIIADRLADYQREEHKRRHGDATASGGQIALPPHPMRGHWRNSRDAEKAGELGT